MVAVSSPGREALGRWLVPLGALLCLLPGASGGLALVGGCALALLVGNPHAAVTRKLPHRMLALSVVGLGAGMDLRAVARAGLQGLGATAISIAAALALGLLLARLLGVQGKTGLLISIGTAICGGSAIAAAVPVVRAEEREASVALGTVFLLNAAALLLFPGIGHGLGLSESQFGLWAALAIHDTSSVVGAAMGYGPRALELATTVKLARALWIIPLTVGLAAWTARSGEARATGRATRPWFILGFLLAAALVTWVPALRPAGDVVASLARRLMVLTLFVIGVNLSPAALRSVGVRPLVQGLLLWLAVASLSAAAIAMHLIGPPA
ncbi:MAG: putative sulfate exporter family transporter [Deltaproteobacteria bacterium]|nr:putative sulfate exporter family transporter [Deltaproteobacteria bacterium]